MRQDNASSENEEYYRLLVNNAMDGLLVCDTNGNYLYASPSMQKLSGFSPDEFVKFTVFDLCHPDDIKANKERIQLLKEGKETSFEARFKGKNGDFIWVEVAAKPVQTPKGDFKIVVVNRDITERKNLQEQLKKYSENLEQLVNERSAELSKTKEYLQQLVSRLPLALVAWDKKSKTKTCNPEATQMFGYSESEFLGRDVASLFQPNQGQTTVNGILEHLEKGEPANIIGENLTKDGKIIQCSWINTPLRDKDGVLDGVLSMIQDITEKKKLQERLKEITYSLSGIKAGESYLTGSLQHCLKIGFDMNSHGVKGLYIVREDPESLIKDYNFDPEEIVSLSLKPIKGFRAVNDIQEVSILITKFLQKGGGIAVLGGLEYLISRFGFNPVFMMIQEKRFEFLESEATLLVPVNLETLDTREKGLLNSELKLIS